VIIAGTLASEGFYAGLFAADLGPNTLVPVDGTAALGEVLDVEFQPLAQLVQSTVGATVSIAGEPTGLVVGDLTGDGIDDTALVTSVGASSSGLLRVFASNGSGGTSMQATYPVGSDPRGIALGDLDGDGRPELVVVSRGSSDVRVFRNPNGSVQGLVAESPVATAQPGSSVAIIAGKTPRVCVASLSGGSVESFRAGAGGLVSNGSLGLAAAPATIATLGERLAVAADATGDAAVGAVFLLEVPALQPPSLHAAYAGPLDPISSGAGDLNADGFPDLAIGDAGGSATILPGSDAGLAGGASIPVGSRPAVDLSIGDIDGDGRPDLAVALLETGTLSGSRVSILRNVSADGGFPSFQSLAETNVGEGVRFVAAAELVAGGAGLVTLGDTVPGLVGGASVLVLQTFDVIEYDPCIGDMNLDGKVDGFDIAIFLQGWGFAGLSDLSGDGTTDGVDITLLISSWGSCLD
jgi:hypothetical protein